MIRALVAWVPLLAVVVACSRKSEAAAALKVEPAASPAASPGLATDKALVDGHLVLVTHSKWDGGQTSDLFDTSPDTLARTENANPAVLEFRLPEARPLQGISIKMGGRDFAVTAVVQPEGVGPAKTYTHEFRQMPADPTLDLDFDTGAAKIASLRVEIKDPNGGDGHIHIRTVRLR